MICLDEGFKINENGIKVKEISMSMNEKGKQDGEVVYAIILWRDEILIHSSPKVC